MKASELNEDALKQLKRDLKLPVTKELVYYKQLSYLNFQIYKVVDFEIIKELPSSSILKLYLENNETVDIMADYFSEMQKSNFVEMVSEN